MNNGQFYANTPAQGRQLEEQRRQQQMRQQTPAYPPQGQSNAQNYGFAQTGYTPNVRNYGYGQGAQYTQQAPYQQGQQNNPYAGQPPRQMPYQPGQNYGTYANGAPQQPAAYPMQQGYQNMPQQPAQPNYYQGYQGYQQPQQQANPAQGQNYGQPYYGVPQQGFTGYQPLAGNTQNYYQPQQQPKQKLPIDFDLILKVLAYGAVPVAFAVVMFLTASAVWSKYVFAAFAAVMCLVMWLKPLAQFNTRITYSAIAAVMILVTCVSGAVSGTASDETTTRADGGVRPPESLTQNFGTDAGSSANNSSVSANNGFDIGILEPTAAPTKENNDTAAQEAKNQAESFFYFWAAGKIDEMASLCAPSWQNTVDAANKSLFAILANRKPVSYQYEKISGTAADTSRTITMEAEIDKGNGRAPSKYRLSVLMLYENGSWYVDPRSLSTQEAIETPAPVEATATPAPQTSTASVSPSTKLYYNPSGGSLYHYDRNCQKVGEKYKPLKGEFTYAELDDGYYKLPDQNSSLSACNVCCGPLWN